MTEYMTMKAPKKYHSKLIPQFRTAVRYLLFNKDLLNRVVCLAPGCKRIIVDPGYLESLHRPNVALSYDAIKNIVPQGVRLETGEIVELDVLILGTGFSLVRHASYENGPTDNFHWC